LTARWVWPRRRLRDPIDDASFSRFSSTPDGAQMRNAAPAVGPVGDPKPRDASTLSHLDRLASALARWTEGHGQ
jgi:hypothetical protein